MSEEPNRNRPFLPAKTAYWLLRFAQSLTRMDLFLNNKVCIDSASLEIIKNIPKNAGIILTPNHADETDPLVCLELARLCGRTFTYMCNREAFDEWNGAAGWALQRMGYFSVERGGHDQLAIDFALNVVKAGQDVLVIFPEGEIFYLNDVVQPLHGGAVNIGTRAMTERRKTEPDWTAYIVPLAIKYRYTQPIEPLLQKRVKDMERKLSYHSGELVLKQRIAKMFSEVLQKQEYVHHLQSETARFEQLGDRITAVRREILAQVEQRYAGIAAAQSRTIDRAWQLGAHLRGMMSKQTTAQRKALIESDLAELKQVAQMASWQPEYWQESMSNERLAEVVLKLEREVYRIKRPTQLARREVHLRVAAPIKLADFLDEYQKDSRACGMD